MKLSLSAVLVAGSFLASSVLADTDYFKLPRLDQVFQPGTEEVFKIEDMPNDEDEVYIANLYREDGVFVKKIGAWTGDDIGDDNDDFTFTWKVDYLQPGRYFAEIDTQSGDDDKIQSRVFSIAEAVPASAAARVAGAPIPTTTPPPSPQPPVAPVSPAGVNAAASGDTSPRVLARRKILRAKAMRSRRPGMKHA